MKSGRMLALDIAAGAVDMQGKTVLPLDFTMAHDAAVRRTATARRQPLSKPSWRRGGTWPW